MESKPEFLTLRVGSILKVKIKYTIYSNSIPWRFESIPKVGIENRKTISLVKLIKVVIFAIVAKIINYINRFDKYNFFYFEKKKVFVLINVQ